MGHFARVSSDGNYDDDFLVHKETVERENHTLISDNIAFNDLPMNEEFSMFEMQQALQSCTDSSPGEDGVTYSMLQHFPYSSLQVLLMLYNTIWSQMRLPAAWKRAIITTPLIRCRIVLSP